MDVNSSAPLLSRAKCWQLLGLGISGWCALYSVAIITWGASSKMVGNTQGGCFAVTMTLASIEAKRHKKKSSIPTDPLQWASCISTEQLNQILAQSMKKQEFRVEPCHRLETEMGFGVRAINAGRTLVFETGRWKEPVIDLFHAQTTEENRQKILADLAVIVGTGTPDEGTRTFIKTCPVRLLVGKELENMVVAEKLDAAKSVADRGLKPLQPRTESGSTMPQRRRGGHKHGATEILGRWTDCINWWRRRRKQ